MTFESCCIKIVSVTSYDTFSTTFSYSLTVNLFQIALSPSATKAITVAYAEN
jgi:hypothetical protein